MQASDTVALVTSASDRSDPGLYARSFADVYHTWYQNLHDVAAIVEAVAERLGAPERAMVIELGSGSGRIAGPLAERFDVIAFDSALSMLRQDCSDAHRLAGDMSVLPLVSGSADAAVIAYNTLFSLGSIDQQRACFAEVARVLRPQGVLAVEGFVAPVPGDEAPFGLTQTAHHSDSDARLAVATWSDPEHPGQITGVHVELGPTGIRSRPWHLTYQSPKSLDDLATAEGLGLHERSADWIGTPFDPKGVRHVSWYRRV